MTAAFTRALLSAFFGVLLLAGCDKAADKPKFLSTDITGGNLGGDLRLADHNGKARTLADFKGKTVVLFFGYTHCPDVCPTTLAELAAAMKKLGTDAQRVQVLFVTIDPERDTLDFLRSYVPSFDPSFLGLHGDAEATARVAKEFKVFYQKQAGARPDQYTMDHSAGTYIFDPSGRLRLFVSYGQGAEVFVHDIKALLASAAGSRNTSAQAKEEEPLPPDEAFKVNASFRDPSTLIVEIAPAANHYLYKDKVRFALESSGTLLIKDTRLPAGEVKNDQFFGRMEIYRQPVRAEVALDQSAKPGALTLRVDYQGCNEKLGVCYPPLQKSFDLKLP